MLDILATYSNQSGAAFPNTLAVNSSGALSTDGTEFIANMVNDYMFGILQAILDYTGQTPNGTLESPSNSQFLEGMRRMGLYPGAVFHAAWNVDPATLGIRAIKLTGQGIVRANYPLLDTLTYCGNANNATYTAFFRADNADGSSRNTAGAYLILPDMRGRVIRALDTAAGVDPDGASRYLGSLQGHAFQGHYHNPLAPATAFVGYVLGAGGLITAGPNYANMVTTGSPITGAHGTVTVTTETRMVNAAFDCYIVY
jgi:hypothetical protein